MIQLGSGLALPRIPAQVAASGGATPPPTAPWEVTGLSGWWDASALSLSQGQQVSEWTDVSGGGHHFVPIFPGFGPYWQQGGGPNNTPWVSFIPSFSSMLTSSPFNGGSFSAAHLFAVLKATADPQVSDGLWGWGTGPISDRYRENADSKVYLGAFSNTAKDCGNWVEDLSAWALLEIVSTSSEYTAFLQQTQKYTTASNAFGMLDDIYLGYSPATPAINFAGGIAEIFFFDAKLSAGDQTAMRTYVDDKYFP